MALRTRSPAALREASVSGNARLDVSEDRFCQLILDDQPLFRRGAKPVDAEPSLGSPACYPTKG
jgi:hypothetical protein